MEKYVSKKVRFFRNKKVKLNQIITGLKISYTMRSNNIISSSSSKSVSDKYLYLSSVLKETFKRSTFIAKFSKKCVYYYLTIIFLEYLCNSNYC